MCSRPRAWPCAGEEPHVRGEPAPEVPGREEPALVATPGLLAAVTAVAVVLTAGVFAVVGDHGTLAGIQRLDEAWLRLMISGRAGATDRDRQRLQLARVGVHYAARAARHRRFSALRRRWWQLAAFVSAIVLSEILIGLLKGIYGRARPPDSLVATSGTSFPSGHAVAASVTAVAAVIALVPAGEGGAPGGPWPPWRSRS